MSDDVYVVNGRTFIKMACGHCNGTGTCPHGNRCHQCNTSTSWVVAIDARYKCSVCNGDGWTVKRID
jgi:hypothetical protein